MSLRDIECHWVSSGVIGCHWVSLRGIVLPIINKSFCGKSKVKRRKVKDEVACLLGLGLFSRRVKLFISTS